MMNSLHGRDSGPEDPDFSSLLHSPAATHDSSACASHLTSGNLTWQNPDPVAYPWGKYRTIASGSGHITESAVDDN